MDSHWRRLATSSLDAPISTPTFHHARDSTMEARPTETHKTAASSFTTGLAGVDQSTNFLFKDMLWWTLGIFCLVMLCIRITDLMWSKLRQVSAMSTPGEKQTYWKYSQWGRMPSLKKHLIYSPFWRKRHNREIRLSKAVNMGTLPSRLQALMLGTYLLSNFIYMFVLNWSNKNRWEFAAQVRGRSGTLAAVNMVPLIILAGRNNPLIPLLRISFDGYNLLHRWIGRIVVVEACIHTIAWATVQVAAGGWSSVYFKVTHDSFLASGTVATLAFIILALLAMSPVRHAFYETFLNTHIILALVILVCTWVHCATAQIEGGLPQLPWIIAIVLLWITERLARVVRMAYCNWSRRGYTEAVVEPMPGETCRVTLHLPRYVDVRPGTHAYLRFKDVNPWESHPFSIAWAEHTPVEAALPVAEKERMLTPTKDNLVTSVSFVVGAQTGFTRKLYDRARASGDRAVTYRAAFEGPYAGHHSLDSYGHALLVAGATGITHQISYLRHLIDGYNNGTVATRRVTLVWIVRDYEALEWVRPWMDKILRLPNRKDLLQIRLFVTRPKNARQIMSASNTVQMFPGRPNIPLLIKKEVAEQVGAMCVTVCGPGGLADDVRHAVRTVQDEGTVCDFVEESFTW